ncbi:MAG: signal peptidase II [Candidatus Woesearchaeota archaeon]
MIKKNYLLLFTSITFLIILLDQITKYFIVKFKPYLDLKILSITFIQNTGAGFGILKNKIIILTIISFLVALAIIIYYKQIEKKDFPQILFALFLGGTIGNLIDRLFRRYVVDFINFKIWPAFNLADASITIAAIGLIYYYWKRK